MKYSFILSFIFFIKSVSMPPNWIECGFYVIASIGFAILAINVNYANMLRHEVDVLASKINELHNRLGG